MKYLCIFFMFFLVSSETKKENLFERFQVMVSQASHLNKRISDVSKKSIISNYLVLKVSGDYHHHLIPTMNILFEVLSRDLSKEEKYKVLELMRALEDFMERMEEDLNACAPYKTVTATVFF
jgi:hypothetical protein